MGSKNRGIAAPAFICSGQTALLDIWEEGSKADVPRGPSVTATVTDVPWPLKHQQPAQEREVKRPCQGIGRVWGVLVTQGTVGVRNWGPEGGREGRTNFLLRIQGLAGIRGQALGHLTASQESIETKVFFDLPHS